MCAPSLSLLSQSSLSWSNKGQGKLDFSRKINSFIALYHSCIYWERKERWVCNAITKSSCWPRESTCDPRPIAARSFDLRFCFKIDLDNCLSLNAWGCVLQQRGKKERQKEGGNWIKKKNPHINIGEIIKQRTWQTPWKLLGNQDLKIHASPPKYN